MKSTIELPTQNHLESTRELTTWIKERHQADQTLYHMMSVELYAIAQTMDEVQPGFWSDYMRNRQEIFQQSLQERQQRSRTIQRPKPELVTRKRSAFARTAGSVAKPDPTPTAERVSVFSNVLDQELPPMEVAQPALSVPVRVVSGLSEIQKGRISVSTPAALPPLTGLPHLVRPPLVKTSPTPTPAASTDDCAPVAIACWLTSHFWLPSTQAGQNGWVFKCLDTITLEPGQSIICQLGFQLSDATAPVRTQLVKRWRSYGLTVNWINSPSNDSSTHPAEAAVKLTHRGDQPCTLQAGQALCQLSLIA
jgi:hypothetical protein